MRRSVFVLCVLGSAVAAPPFAFAQESAPEPPPETATLREFLAVEPEHAALGTVFYIYDPVRRNQVTFTSEAPLEDIIGISNDIAGYAVFDPQHPEKGGAGKFRVPVAGLDTGIPLRDEHLAGSDWLDAERFPFIAFRIERVADVKEVSKTEAHATYDVTLVGDFSVHGRTRRLEVPARVAYLPESPETLKKMPGDLLAGRAEFTIALADYAVTGPRGMGVIGSKVGQTIQIEVRFTGTTRRPELE